MNRRELVSAGEPVSVKASKNAKITPLKGFKDAVMSPAPAPRLAWGVWPPPTKAPTRAARYISRLPGRRGR
ncbi:MAG: hypothetical protein DLM54_03690 [Acidimicrobiales bacterium]|nr:MAG: hypothetical protein DLM54_03690 [Acidimicrobiales bacterium]